MERVWAAVYTLATSAEPIQTRVLNAGLVLVFLQPRDFHDVEGRTKFTALMDILTSSQPSGREGAIEATVTRMSDEQAVAAAKMILELDTHIRGI